MPSWAEMGLYVSRRCYMDIRNLQMSFVIGLSPLLFVAFDFLLKSFLDEEERNPIVNVAVKGLQTSPRSSCHR